MTTQYNGAAELLGGGGVVVADPHDAAELGGAVRAVLDPARRGAFAEAARLAGRAWTFDKHYAALLAVFAEAAARRPGAVPA